MNVLGCPVVVQIIGLADELSFQDLPRGWLREELFKRLESKLSAILPGVGFETFLTLWDGELEVHTTRAKW